MSPFDHYCGLRPVIHPPRDLSRSGRILRRLLATLDRVTSCASSPDLAMDALERDGQTAGFIAMQDRMAEGLNARRRAAWRARFGGLEAYDAIIGVQPPLPAPVHLFARRTVR